MTTSIQIASRLSSVKPSITLAVSAKARALQAQGVDVISFGAGEPDFDTPEHIKDAVRHALDSDQISNYTAVGGIPPLRAAVAETMTRAHGFEVSADNVMVSCGAKHSLFNVFMAMIDKGDEVIILSPYWVSYPAMVQIAEGTPVIVETRAADGFSPDPAAIRAAITDRTRAIIVNTPSNPSGAMIDKASLQAIAEIALEHDLYVISDDIYRSLVYGDAHYTSLASLSPEIAARTILVDGVSKSYAMTGWRIGFTAGPTPLIKAMSKIQGQSTSGASHISQIAALAALTGPQDCVSEMLTAFDERRKVMVAMLRDIPEVTCLEPQGAFYSFPDLSAYVGRKTPEGVVLDTDVALCEHLVGAGPVALVPGSAFGAPGHVRLSYASSMDNIKTGLTRLSAALGKLSAA